MTVTNFVKMMDQLKVKDTSWHFFAVLALARTDEEAQTFRNMIKKTIGNAEYKNITVIDALSSPLGLELFEEYVSYSAMSMYYNGNNNQQSKDNARKAGEVLDRTWRIGFMMDPSSYGLMRIRTGKKRLGRMRSIPSCRRSC